MGGCPHSHGRCLIPVEWPLSPSQHGELHAPPPSKSRNRSRKCVLQEQTLITETPAWGFNICTGLGRRQSEPGEESVNNLKRERSNLTSMMIFFFFSSFFNGKGKFPFLPKGRIWGQDAIKIYWEIHKAGLKPWQDIFSLEREVSWNGQVHTNMRVFSEYRLIIGYVFEKIIVNHSYMLRILIFTNKEVVILNFSLQRNHCLSWKSSFHSPK